MVADTTVRNVALGIAFGELRGGGSFLVDNPSFIESTERKMKILRLENM